MAKDGFRRSPSDLIGQSFGPYKLVRRLGTGGMAETFEAIRHGPGDFSQRVCLKLVLPFLRDNEDFIQLFEREARLAAKLRHSNIVGVIDFGVIDGTSYMALELVDGVDFRALLDAQPGKRLPHELVALIGSDLASALDHAHNPPLNFNAPDSDGGSIIHRDLSPSNVLISRNGEVLLTDFGVAKAVSKASEKQSAVKGKVPYMSPEQLRAEPLDGRADLFALGVVLFESLAGRRPYEGEHDPATIMAILEGDHPPLHELAPDAPAKLCRIVESLIETDREARPESASALAELLDELVPSPRVRRRLGGIAAETLPETATPISEERLVAERSTKLQDASDGMEVSAQLAEPEQRSTGRAVSSSARKEPRPRRWIAGLLVLVTATIVGWSILSRPDAVSTPKQELPPVVQPEEPSAPPEPAPREPSTDATATAQPQAPASTTKHRPASAEPRPARLTVVVFPWGNVWLDGKHMGQAPLEDHTLRPGRHEISAGRRGPTTTRTVRLRPGQRRTVTFELEH
jgi:serine/threonine protein kinase